MSKPVKLFSGNNRSRFKTLDIFRLEISNLQESFCEIIFQCPAGYNQGFRFGISCFERIAVIPPLSIAYATNLIPSPSASLVQGHRHHRPFSARGAWAAKYKGDGDLLQGEGDVVSLP